MACEMIHEGELCFHEGDGSAGRMGEANDAADRGSIEKILKPSDSFEQSGLEKVGDAK